MDIGCRKEKKKKDLIKAVISARDSFDCQIVCFVFPVLLHNLSALDNFLFPQNFSTPSHYTNNGTGSLSGYNPPHICLCADFEGFRADVNYYPLEHSFKEKKTFLFCITWASTWNYYAEACVFFFFFNTHWSQAQPKWAFVSQKVFGEKVKNSHHSSQVAASHNFLFHVRNFLQVLMVWHNYIILKSFWWISCSQLNHVRQRVKPQLVSLTNPGPCSLRYIQDVQNELLQNILDLFKLHKIGKMLHNWQ